MSKTVQPGPTAFPERPPEQVFVSRGLHAEHHVTVPALARLWAASDDFIRELFRNEPGVFQYVRPAGTRKRKDGSVKRQHTLMTIPESVARRVHQRLSGRAAAASTAEAAA